MVIKCILVMFTILFSGCASVQQEDLSSSIDGEIDQQEDLSYTINGEIKYLSEDLNKYEIIYDSYPEYMNDDNGLFIRFYDGINGLSGCGSNIKFASNKVILHSGYKYPNNKNLNVMVLFDSNYNFLPDENEVFYILKDVSKNRYSISMSFERQRYTYISY